MLEHHMPCTFEPERAALAMMGFPSLKLAVENRSRVADKLVCSSIRVKIEDDMQVNMFRRLSNPSV